MDREDFVRQLSALHRGELQLEEPESNGLSRFAGGALFELRQYISALEAGYRKLWGMMERNMDKVNAGGITLGGLLRNQWSDEAALGYAFIACNAAGIQPDQAVEILEQMGEIMDRVGRQDAAAVHRRLMDGGTDSSAVLGKTERGTDSSAALGMTGRGTDSSAALGMTAGDGA